MENNNKVIEKYPYIKETELRNKRKKYIKQFSLVCFVSLCSLILINYESVSENIKENAINFYNNSINTAENNSDNLEEDTDKEEVGKNTENKQEIKNTFSKDANVALKNYHFLVILKKTENYSPNFYKDNEGIAIAYGWNISKNTADFNNKISSLLHFNKKDRDLIAKYSGNNLKEVPKELKNITVNSKFINSSINYMYDFYLNEFVDVLNKKSNRNISIEALNKFSNEEKAVFAHMAYKLGKTRLYQYNKFFTQLIKMIDSPEFKKGDFNRLSNEVSYTFKYKGKKFVDENAQNIHRYHLMS